MWLDKLKKDVKKKWKFYLVSYIIGYLYPLFIVNNIDMKVLFPIKILGIVFAIGLGNGCYYMPKEVNVLAAGRLAIKYGLPSILILIITVLLSEGIKSFTGIDILPYLYVEI